jgi:hypothetical protein
MTSKWTRNIELINFSKICIKRAWEKS